MTRNFPSSAVDRRTGPHVAGSALVTTILTVALLSMIAGTLLSLTRSKQTGPFQAASWHESGSAAEGGIEVALNALRRSITEGDAAAWSGWTTPTPAPSASPTASASASPTATPFIKKYITENDLLSHNGEGNNAVRAIVEITIPTGTGSLNPPSIPSNRLAYLVRSTGFANVPGPARQVMNKSDLALRKLNIFKDFRSNAAVTTPQMTRVVEAIVVPVSPFAAAMAAKEPIEITGGSNMIVDGYNSQVSPYSYSAASRTYNGNIVTNAKKKPDEDVIRLENVKVYGLAAKGSGRVNIHNSDASLSGEIIDGFYREMKSVQSPRNMTAFSTPESSPTGNSLNRPAKATYNIMAGTPGGTPKYYKFDKIHLHDGEIMKIKKNGTDGGIAEIWVTGDIVIHNGGRIEVEDGANVVFYFEKNLTLQEKDASKPALKNLSVYPTGTAINPGAAQFYGVVPNKDKKKVKIKSNVAAVIYAPDHEFEVNLKSARHFYGSLAGRKFKVKGQSQIHFDEAVSDIGKPYDYTIESWQEDWFDPNVRVAPLILAAVNLRPAVSLLGAAGSVF